MRSTISHPLSTSGELHQEILQCCLLDGWLRSEIAAVLTETKRWNKRLRRLPADLVLTLVLLMGAARSLSVPLLLMLVGDHLRRSDPSIPLKDWVTEEAFYHARKRLGVEPAMALFERTAAGVKPSRSFLGLRPWGLDGTTLTVPDTESNVEAFGRPGTSEGQAAFPLLSLISLIDTTTRRIRDVVLGRYKACERDACVYLTRHLGKDDVLFVDAGVTASWLLKYFKDANVHYVARASENCYPTILRELGPGDYLVEVDVWETIPRPEGDTRRRKRHISGRIRLRMIEYKVPGHDRVRLFTDLEDPLAYPALDIVTGYHLRWECELGFDEIKTHQLAPARGTVPTSLRSKTPEGVLQEAFGMLTVYNIVRSLMTTAAKLNDIDPLQISFIQSVHALRLTIPRLISAGPGDRASIIADLVQDLSSCRNPRSRRPRQCPRAVKKRGTHFPAKRDRDRERPLPVEIRRIPTATGMAAP